MNLDFCSSSYWVARTAGIPGLWADRWNSQAVKGEENRAESGGRGVPRKPMRLLCGLLFCGVGFSGGMAKAGDKIERPNIVIILADDHGRQAISSYGSKLIQTPNIDRIAKDGVLFSRAMASNSISSPSRACLLTGKYNHMCGVEKLDAAFDGSQQTFPKLLQKAGYQTAIVGKWHLLTEPTGFDFFSVMPGQGQYFDCPFKETGQPWGDGNKGGVVKKGYATDVITDISLDWLKHREPGKPFCLMIHHKAPHNPHEPAPRHSHLFDDVVFPEPSNLLDDYAGRAPEKVANQIMWSNLLVQKEPVYQGIIKQYNGDKAHDLGLMYQAFLRNYLRLVTALDENVGRVLDSLDESGLSKNTIVIYLSDNGFFLGEHGFHNKMWMYEESLHIPIIIRMPPGMDKVKAGTVCGELVGMPDVAPTVLDLAGVKVPEDIQGESMRRLLRGDVDGWRQAFYYHYYGIVWSPKPDNWIAYHEVTGVCTKTSKLIFYPTWKDGTFWEYFDLVKDPHEMQNLTSDPAQQKNITEMKERLRALAVHYKDKAMVKMLDDDKQNPSAAQGMVHPFAAQSSNRDMLARRMTDPD